MKECIVLAEKKFEEAMNAAQLRHTGRRSELFFLSNCLSFSTNSFYCILLTAEQAALAKSWEDKIGKAGQDMEQAKSDLQRLQETFDKQVHELKDTNKKQAKTAKVSTNP